MRSPVVVLVVLALCAGVLAIGAAGIGLGADSEQSVETTENGSFGALETETNDSSEGQPPDGQSSAVETQSTSATLEVARGESATLELRFTASGDGNQTFDADEGPEADGVDLSFVEWRDTTDGESGTSSEWEGDGGNTYEVTYEASVDQDPAIESGQRTVDVSVNYDAGTASESFTVDVNAPAFGGDTTQSDSVTLRGDRGTSTTDSVSVSVDNTGEGVLIPDDVTFSSVPDGVELSATTPDEIAARGSQSLSIDADVPHTEDDFEFGATVSDNLGNEQTYTLSVNVEKPPVVDIVGGPVDIENATAGDSVETPIEVEEASGFDSVDSISYDVSTDDSDIASLDLSELSDVSLDSLGVATRNATLTIDEDAEQYRDLSFTATLSPADDDRVETETEFRSEVLYQGEFTEVELINDTVVYNEPKDEVDTVPGNLTVDLENRGDFPLNVTEENVTIAADELTVSDVVVDEEIAAQSNATAEVLVDGDPDAFEQVLPFRFELFGQTLQGDPVAPALLEESIAIEHERELVLDQTTVEAGRVQIGADRRVTIGIGERLGYQDIEGIDVEELDGPDTDWLTFPDDPPETIPAGETVDVPINIAFDLDADLLTEYEWAFLVSGTDIENQEFTVTGTPEPVNVDPLREDLEGLAGEEASDEIIAEMLTIVDEVEAGVESGDIPRSDIGTALSAGRSVVLLLTQLERAETELEDGGPDEAQESIVRSATAYNTFVLFAGEFEDEGLAERAQRIDGLASERVNAVVSEQEAQLQRQLDTEPPLLTQVTLNRQLAQLATLSGNSDRAAELEQTADEAFESYTDRIEAGEQSFQDGRAARDRIAADRSIDVFGQPILVNPLQYAGFLNDRSDALAAYDDAVEQFEAAGATERAETVAAERETAATEFAVAQRSLFVSLGVYVLIVVATVGYVLLAVRAFRLDSRAVEPDDFLE